MIANWYRKILYKWWLNNHHLYNAQNHRNINGKLPILNPIWIKYLQLLQSADSIALFWMSINPIYRDLSISTKFTPSLSDRSWSSSSSLSSTNMSSSPSDVSLPLVPSRQEIMSRSYYSSSLFMLSCCRSSFNSARTEIICTGFSSISTGFS